MPSKFLCPFIGRRGNCSRRESLNILQACWAIQYSSLPCFTQCTIWHFLAESTLLFLTHLCSLRMSKLEPIYYISTWVFFLSCVPWVLKDYGYGLSRKFETVNHFYTNVGQGSTLSITCWLLISECPSHVATLCLQIIWVLKF